MVLPNVPFVRATVPSSTRANATKSRDPSPSLRPVSEVSMRRILMCPMALAAVWALPSESWAQSWSAPPEGEDDVVVVDDMEGEPTGDGTTPPAGDGTTTPPAGDGGDVGDLLGGDDTTTTPDPAVAGETG